jgi:phosphoenolpyruvate carboxykinase (GTP)
MRVLKWAIEQVEGKTSSQDGPIGLVPTTGAIDVEGLDVSAEDMAAVGDVTLSEWREELPLIESWFETIGKKLPQQMEYQLNQLKARITT